MLKYFYFVAQSYTFCSWFYSIRRLFFTRFTRVRVHFNKSVITYHNKTTDTGNDDNTGACALVLESSRAGRAKRFVWMLSRISRPTYVNRATMIGIVIDVNLTWSRFGLGPAWTPAALRNTVCSEASPQWFSRDCDLRRYIVSSTLRCQQIRQQNCQTTNRSSSSHRAWPGAEKWWENGRSSREEVASTATVGSWWQRMLGYFTWLAGWLLSHRDYSSDLSK